MATHPYRAANLAWLLLSLAVIALDQLSKYWVMQHLTLHEARPVFPFLNLNLMYNTGAAYSFLGSAGGWQRWLFAGVAVIISVLILIWLIRLPQKNKSTACALALILGGALGNLWDRLILGHVIDFIDFYVKNWHMFGAFNVADAAICVGVALLVLITLLGSERDA
jgi:signal peptidase II